MLNLRIAVFYFTSEVRTLRSQEKYRRKTVRNELRQGHLAKYRPHRKKTSLPFPARNENLLFCDGGLQFQLRQLPELADFANRKIRQSDAGSGRGHDAGKDSGGGDEE